MAWMFPTIVKNLFSRPATRRYPFKDIREPFPGARGSIYFDTKKCDLCSDCVRVCPAEAIEVDSENKQIKYYPFRCIYCGTCVETCLQGAITQDAHYSPPNAEKIEELYKIEA
jgi:ech hydrogenase subunit F